jgi:hypothetical protein
MKTPGPSGRDAPREPGAWGRAARAVRVRYHPHVRKIIREILILLWKALRLVLWKWLRPILGKLVFYAVLVVGAIALLVFLVSRF